MSDTTITEVMIPPLDTFAVSYQSALTYIYNPDSSLQKNIESLDWADENIPFLVEDNYTYAPCQSALPVSLLNFTGTLQSNDALLQWQTTNETNTAYFSVLRSIDGIHFTNAGRVNASGNTTTARNYFYTDANISLLSATKVYYKLGITDKDGSISYSKIIELNLSAGKLTVFALPNPVTDVLSVYSNVTMPGALVNVTDMSGKIVYIAKQNLLANNKLNISFAGLAKGLYVITVQSAKEKYSLKIMK